MPPAIPHTASTLGSSNTPDRASEQVTINVSNGCCADAPASDCKSATSNARSATGEDRVSQQSPPATIDTDGIISAVAKPHVASKLLTCISQRPGLPRTRTRSNSEPRIAKMPKHRTNVAPLATLSSCTATLDQDDPKRGRASNFATKVVRTTSEVSKAKRFRVAPSTARACITSHAMATIESAKRLSSRPLTPRNSQPQLSAKD